MTISIIPFSEWAKGVKQYNNQPDKLTGKLGGLCSHWPGSDIEIKDQASEIKALKSILAYHLSMVNEKTKKKTYATIAYSFAIGQATGTIYELRGLTNRPASQGDGNGKDYGILWLMDKDEQPSDQAKNSYQALRNHLISQGVGTRQTTHSPAYSNTACPGEGIKAYIAGKPTTSAPAPSPQPPASTGAKFPLDQKHYYSVFAGKGTPGYITCHSGTNNTNDHPAIKRIQAKVGVKEDGIFGPITLKAVKHWQQLNGVASDGKVGPKTWARMFS